MSEITAEHVAEALALAQRGGFEDEQGAGHLMQAREWSQHVPDYVQRAWLDRGLGTYITALTRWHAELVAAETPRKVARWDADADHYVLTPPYTHTYAYVGITTKRETAIAWGYEIEGGPEPVRDWKSDRAIAAIWPTPKPVVHIGVDLANGPDWDAEHAALTRWRDELAAAEPVAAPRWCWREPGDDQLHGSFASLDEAKADARDRSKLDAVLIGETVPVCLEGRIDTDHIIDALSASVAGDASWEEDPRIYAKDEAAANEALRALVAEHFYLEDNPFTMGDEVLHGIRAAEPVRRVARWDAERGMYALVPSRGDGPCRYEWVQTAESAIAWGYEIDGGPEPEPAEDSPERLRERREALGLSTEQAADLIKDGWCDEDIARCEDPRSVCDPRARTRYAAALSAAEAERVASKPHMTPAFRKAIVEMRAGGASLSEVADAYSLGIGEVSDALDAECVAPAPPAPEVVDVPQPIVKRLRSAEAQWCRGETVMRIEVDESGYVYAPIALLRAMLADIDAQQGGAS